MKADPQATAGGGGSTVYYLVISIACASGKIHFKTGGFFLIALKIPQCHRLSSPCKHMKPAATFCKRPA
jgi:hypothetical protein